MSSMDRFTKELLENLLRQSNEQSNQIEHVSAIVELILNYLRENDDNFDEVLDEIEHSTVQDEDPEEDFDSSSLEQTIPFNVVHINDSSAEGLYNPVRGCACTPFDCPFKNGDCQAIRLTKMTDEDQESDED